MGALEAEGLAVREWRFDPERIELTPEDPEPLLCQRTRLVCFTHYSNLIGTVHDAAATIHRVHDAGVLACIDAAACAPHRRVDVKSLHADFHFLSIYKVFGPHLGMFCFLRSRRGVRVLGRTTAARSSGGPRLANLLMLVQIAAEALTTHPRRSGPC